jgi:hypothetical protein
MNIVKAVNVARGAASPDHSLTTSYHALRTEVVGGDGFEAARFQGVAATHTLFVDHERGLMIYAHAPDGGPSMGLRNWARSEHGFPAWKIRAEDGYPTEQELYDAILWVLEQSTREVALETDTEVVYR